MKKILKETIANKILNWIMTEDPQAIEQQNYTDTHEKPFVQMG